MFQLSEILILERNIFLVNIFILSRQKLCLLALNVELSDRRRAVSVDTGNVMLFAYVGFHVYH